MPKTLPSLPQIPVELPSSILEPRPDVAVAERTWQQQMRKLVSLNWQFFQILAWEEVRYKSSKLSDLFMRLILFGRWAYARSDPV